MGERLKNNNRITTLDLLKTKEVKVANAGELLESFSYNEVPNYNHPDQDQLGLISTVDRVWADYGPSINSSDSDVFMHNQINPTSGGVGGTVGVYDNEWWRERSGDDDFVDPYNVLQGSDWDIDTSYIPFGGSLSFGYSPTIMERIVFSPDRNYLELFDKRCRTVLLPRKIPTYEFLNLSKRWYEGKFAILIQ